MPDFRIAAVIIAALSISGIALGQDTQLDLRNAMSVSESLAEQEQIVDRMHQLLRDGGIKSGQTNVMIYGLSQKPVFAQERTMALLRDMAQTPDIAEVTVNAIANQFTGSRLTAETARSLGDILFNYQQRQALPDGAVSALQRSLNRNRPVFNREIALAVLLAGPDELRTSDAFLDSVAQLLNPEVSIGERGFAMELLIEASDTQYLPKRARSGIHKAAQNDPDAGIRVAAWPFVMEGPAQLREKDRGRWYFLGKDLTDQLVAPVTGSKPSFIDADEKDREQAVALLNEYWHPEYRPEYIDVLIRLVDMHGSPASMAKLTELRAINAQLTALAAISPASPAIEQALDKVAIANLGSGSLVGPLEAIEYSGDHDEWAVATKRLLDEYPDGPVPMRVADAAFKVLSLSEQYDSAAADLFARSDQSFRSREAELIALAGNFRKVRNHAVPALQHLHGDVDIAYLVRQYANDYSVDNSFRGSLVGMLLREVSQSGELDQETAEAVIDIGQRGESYFTVSTATRVLEAGNVDVPWSMRIRHRDFQWAVLAWVGIAALAIGSVSSFILLALIVFPGRATGLSGGQRVVALIVWLILAAAFLGAAVLAFALSLGHTSSPPPDKAAPWYVAALIVAVLIALQNVWLFRRRSDVEPDQAASASSAD